MWCVYLCVLYKYIYMCLCMHMWGQRSVSDSFLCCFHLIFSHWIWNLGPASACWAEPLVPFSLSSLSTLSTEMTSMPCICMWLPRIWTQVLCLPGKHCICSSESLASMFTLTVVSVTQTFQFETIFLAFIYWGNGCHQEARVKASGQLAGDCSLLLPHGSRGMTLGHTWCPFWAVTRK